MSFRFYLFYEGIIVMPIMFISGKNIKRIFIINKKIPIMTMQNKIIARKNTNLNAFSICFYI